jgi:hypothetical protein
MKVVGIDLGLTGAIATLDGNVQGLTQLYDMPVYDTMVNKKARKAFDINGILKIISCDIQLQDYVFIEKVQPFAMPGKTSCSANFSLGYIKGIFEAVLRAKGIRYEFVNPKDWQSYFGIIKPKDAGKDWQTKGQSYSVASKLFPGLTLTTVKGRVLDGRSDALLIAEWGNRRLKGGDNASSNSK